MSLDFYVDAARAEGLILDDFQIDACRALEDGRDVLLSAPTGAGKTVVAHFGVELAFATSTRCIYTTPMKALSNQKYRELASRYGANEVGLMTGDITLNRNAPIVVMTTEVLRNLLYARVDLGDLGYVILDEVHYLADPERGPTWEEVILELDRSVRIVSLSATIANIEEFHGWLASVRGNTELVTTSIRPVPLLQHVFAGRKLHQLYSGGPSRTLGAGREPNPGAIKAWNSGARGGPAARRRVLEALQSRSMLPAIHFIFSRKGCDQAVRDLLKDGVSLTTRDERKAIHQAADELRTEMTKDDRAALRFNSFERALAAGYAAHHAGVYPPFKELIERLMQRGLIKLVYATGTLALGINMPVRTTVIESLEKFNGTDFSPLTGIEYTQLIGRAGRRGKDDVGHAVVIAGDGDVETLLNLGSGELEPLNSAFFPSYNTVVNVLAARDYDSARGVLARSFAQYQKDAELAELEVKAERVRTALAEMTDRLEGLCDLGSVAEYVRLRHTAGRASSQARKKAKRVYRERIFDSFAEVETGDVVALALEGHLEYGYVVQRKKDKVRLATTLGNLVWVSPSTVRSELRIVGEYTLPQGMRLREPGSRDILAENIVDLVSPRLEVGLDDDLLQSWDRHAVRENSEVIAHPVHSCPDRDSHLEEATGYLSLLQQSRNLDNETASHTDSVGLEFDATANLLAHLGILRGAPGDYTVGDGATPLRRIHSQHDLLIYQCLLDRRWRDTDPVTLAAMVSAFTFKIGRGRQRPTYDIHLWNITLRNQEFLIGLERKYGISRQSEISAHASSAVAAWANGANLETVLGLCSMLPGDFITGIRRTIDLLTHIEFAVTGTPLEDVAHEARRLLARPGIVDTVIGTRSEDRRERS